MKPKRKITRRKFVCTSAATPAFTIIPSHVLGGGQHVAPSDKLNVAYIGCGTQGIRDHQTKIRFQNACCGNRPWGWRY